jgi:hypothetical protein
VEDYEETTALQATLVHALSDGDEKRLEFCGEMFDKMGNDDD